MSVEFIDLISFQMKASTTDFDACNSTSPKKTFRTIQDTVTASHRPLRRNYARHTPVYGRSSRFYVVGTGAFAGSQRGGVSRGAADIPATAATAAAAAAAAAAADLAAGSVCAPTPTIVGARNGRGTPTRRSVQRRTSPLAAQRCEPVQPVRVHRAYHHAPARAQV